MSGWVSKGFMSVHTQLWVKSPNRDGIVLFQVTVHRQGEGDGDRPVHLQLRAIIGQQVNRDGCDRSQIKPLFCHCTREKYKNKTKKRTKWIWLGLGIPDTRLETRKTQMNWEFWDKKRGKQTRERQERQERAWKHKGWKFSGQVCLCFLEGEAVLVKRTGYSEDKETGQTWTKPNEQVVLSSPPFSWVPESKVESLSCSLPTSLLLLSPSLFTCQTGTYLCCCHRQPAGEGSAGCAKGNWPPSAEPLGLRIRCWKEALEPGAGN